MCGERDEEESVRSIRQGDAVCRRKVGDMHYYGQGLEVNYTEAARHYGERREERKNREEGEEGEGGGGAEREQR